MLFRSKEGRYIMIKGSIQEEDITIINIYAPSIGAPRSLFIWLKHLGIKYGRDLSWRNKNRSYNILIKYDLDGGYTHQDYLFLSEDTRREPNFSFIKEKWDR